MNAIPITVPNPMPKSAALKNKLETAFKHEWVEMINNENTCPKLRTYKTYKSELKFEPYLTLPSYRFRKAIAQFRSGTHWLKIETGRYENAVSLKMRYITSWSVNDFALKGLTY